jgi:hypothetical protein
MCPESVRVRAWQRVLEAGREGAAADARKSEPPFGRPSETALTDWITASATAIAALSAVAALAYAARQLRLLRTSTEAAQRVSQGDFLLRLEEILGNHGEVAARLRPGGAWSKPGEGPCSGEDWARVEEYMGLFQRLNALEESGLVNRAYLSRFYGYRLSNLWANESIRVAKLTHEAEYWRDFIALSRKVCGELPGRFHLMEAFSGD